MAAKRGKKTPAKAKARRAKAPAKKRPARAGRARVATARGGEAHGRKTPASAKARGATSRAGAKPAKGGGAAELNKLKARFERERGQLETRLTETVREIGQLRHHEMRATQLERQLAERDRTISELRGELERFRAQASHGAGRSDAQPTLDFGSQEPGDLDDLDDTVSLDDEDDDLM